MLRPKIHKRIKINEQAYKDLITVADHASVQEACGFLLGTLHEQEELIAMQTVPVRNAVTRRGGFGIPDHEYRRVERLARKLNLQIVAVYHSHHHDDGQLSLADRRCLAHSALPWIIIHSVPPDSDAKPRLLAYNALSGTPFSVQLV